MNRTARPNGNTLQFAPPGRRWGRVWLVVLGCLTATQTAASSTSRTERAGTQFVDAIPEDPPHRPHAAPMERPRPLNTPQAIRHATRVPMALVRAGSPGAYGLLAVVPAIPHPQAEVERFNPAIPVRFGDGDQVQTAIRGPPCAGEGSSSSTDDLEMNPVLSGVLRPIP